jgi:secretion/DNA translocation related TadE-like protein
MSTPADAERGLPSRERGSISVTAAGVMVVLAVMALALSDVARVLSAASAAQTAADAAALAAAQELAIPSKGSSPSRVAADYAARNGGDLVDCDCPSDGTDAVVEVRVPVGPLLLFGGDRTVTARARAVVDRG